jgi:hypothetical protein
MPAVRIIDSGDLRRVNKQLRQQANGKELLKELRTGLRDVLNPIKVEVQIAYRSAPSKGHASSSRARRSQPNLRTLLAKATRVEIRATGRQAGARLRVDGRKMPSGMKALPRYYEGTKRPWRHPVFGFRGGLSVINRWVSQQPNPTFDRTVEPHEDEARRKVEQVVDGVRRKLEAGR